MAHLDEFRFYFMRADYHIICISETWLRPEIADAVIALPGYALHRCDRSERVGGRVAFYLADNLCAAVLRDSAGAPAHRPEYIVAEICFRDASKFLLAIVYRPPNSGYLNDFFKLFLELQVIGTLSSSGISMQICCNVHMTAR